MATNIVVNLPRRTTNVIINYVQRRNAPVNVPPTATGKRRFRFEVETDPHKLVNYCCGLNYHNDEPPIKLKPDNEYPEWLWKLRLGPKPKSWDLEKGTKEYYLRLEAEGAERNRLIKLKAPKEKKIVGKTLLEQEEYLHRIRFAALAHLEDDAGLPLNSNERDWWDITQTQDARGYYLAKNEKVLYKDKIQINAHLKNYWRDNESSFKGDYKRVTKRTPYDLKPILDSKRRYRYAST